MNQLRANIYFVSKHPFLAPRQNDPDISCLLQSAYEFQLGLANEYPGINAITDINSSLDLLDCSCIVAGIPAITAKPLKKK